MTGRTKGALGAAAILLTGFCIVRFFMPPDTTGQQGVPGSSSIQSSISPNSSKAAPSRSSAPIKANTSDLNINLMDINGTDSPGSGQSLEESVFIVDFNGKLLIGPGCIAFFEQEMESARDMGAGENDDEIQKHVQRMIYEHLDGDAAREAIGLFDKYLGYQKALRNAGKSPGEQGAGDKWALEREHFGEEKAAILFGQHEDKQADQIAGFMAEERALRAKGAGAEEIQRFRVDRLGLDTAQSLLERDRRRLDWRRRIQAAEMEINRLKSGSLGKDSMSIEENKYLERFFAPDERERAKAILGL